MPVVLATRTRTREYDRVRCALADIIIIDSLLHWTVNCVDYRCRSHNTFVFTIIFFFAAFFFAWIQIWLQLAAKWLNQTTNSGSTVNCIPRISTSLFVMHFAWQWYAVDKDKHSPRCKSMKSNIRSTHKRTAHYFAWSGMRSWCADTAQAAAVRRTKQRQQQTPITTTQR